MKQKQQQTTRLSVKNVGGLFLMHYVVLITSLSLSVLNLKYPNIFHLNLHHISVVRTSSEMLNNIFGRLQNLNPEATNQANYGDSESDNNDLSSNNLNISEETNTK